MVDYLIAFVIGVISSLTAVKISLRWKSVLNFILFRSRFRTITGIKHVEPRIRDGITPDKALSLCRNNIRFLGVAANKIVNSNEFNSAMQRCNRGDEPIKFLLSDPENPILQHAAMRAGRNLDEYKAMVNNTLARITALKNERGYNIEVRLYKSENDQGPPSFRLFFIDNKSVLASYYVFGEGDGLDMPQIEVEKTSNDRDTANFYYAFNHYFNALWESSKPFP